MDHRNRARRFISGLVLCLVAAVVHSSAGEADSRASALLESLIRGSSEDVFVVAHRGDWRNYPENSLPAIESSIALGVEIVEIDVRRTKDGHFVLMHDTTVDRTTTGIGMVSDLSLAEIRDLNLRDGLGMRTEFRVPTLREALETASGRVLLNLDKSYLHLRELVPILEETGTLRHVIVKGSAPLHEVLQRYGDLLDRLEFMPVVRFEDPAPLDRIHEWLSGKKPPAIEFVFAEFSDELEAAFELCNSAGVRIWVNTLWPQLAGGLSDDLALSDPDRVYGLLLDRGVSMLQTDRPKELEAYIARRANKEVPEPAR